MRRISTRKSRKECECHQEKNLDSNDRKKAGFEVRTAIMRLYFSFRGGDRPKNAEREFPKVCVTPKGAYEPWMLFRKPIAEKTVAENLRRWKTGGVAPSWPRQAVARCDHERANAGSRGSDLGSSLPQTAALHAHHRPVIVAAGGGRCS
ncbi:MAG: hypothetical protein M0Q93_02260 [Terrimicrobiaceae bacterium]|nr:hypothetical protein [Terrimicrobiaceae bacterium]